ncbi:MAG: filamentous hemagglutinin N-terminal domain-containing protein [Coleofasciculaceae cyanobacterium]
MKGDWSHQLCTRRVWLAIGVLAQLALEISLPLASATAEIIPDQTLGDEASRLTRDVLINGLSGNYAERTPLKGDRIDGGATRGANLFHSFQEFNVLNGQQVYFANPAGIENILSRVTGANGSDIFGKLGVLGNANLFLINPNGIVFGQNSQLDIRGSFVASTANSFTFADGSRFSAIEPQAAPLLTINLTPGLQHASSGSTIVNSGNLVVGQNLTLAAENLELEGQLQAGKDLQLLARNRVQIRDSTVEPFVATAGGQLLVEGKQKVDIFALNHPNSGLFSGTEMVLRSANPIGGDAHYWSGGNFRIEQLDGNLADLESPYDPIIRASGDVSFAGYTGASLHIFAGGSVEITGDVTITQPEELPTNAIQETVTLFNGDTIEINGNTTPTLDIRAGTLAYGTPGTTGNTAGFPTGIPNTGGTATSADIRISGNISSQGGTVFLTNQYQPNSSFNGVIDVADVNATTIRFDSRGSITKGTLTYSDPVPALAPAPAPTSTCTATSPSACPPPPPPPPNFTPNRLENSPENLQDDLRDSPNYSPDDSRNYSQNYFQENSQDNSDNSDNSDNDPIDSSIPTHSNGLTDLSGQILRRCAVRGTGSEFIVTGREGLPPSPDTLLTGNNALADLGDGEMGRRGDGETEEMREIVASQPNLIVEAQGWVKHADGTVVLTNQSPTLMSQLPEQPKVNCQNTTL